MTYNCLKMSAPSWYIIAIFSIILQQISFRYSEGKRHSHGCREPKQFLYTMKINNTQSKALNSFEIACSTETVFEVRYVNNELCACGRIKRDKPNIKLHQDCLNRSTVDFTVEISVEKIHNRLGENCTFTFNFVPAKGSFPFTLTMRFLPGNVITSTFIIWRAVTRSSVFTRLFTSHITSTVFATTTLSVIDQPSTTSSLIVSQSALRNSTASSTGISSTVVTRQPSQISIPFYTAIIITPKSSVLATPSLSTEPAPTMSSIKEGYALKTSTSIKDSPTTSDVLPSSTLSPDGEEMKKLKEDIDYINNVNTSTVNIKDKKTIERVLDAAANVLNTNLTTGDQKEDPGMQAVEVLQDLGNSISKQLDLPGNESSVTFQEVTDDLVFGVAVINATTSPGFSFPSGESKATGNEKINIPSSVFVSESDKAYFVGIIFKAYREMRNNTGDLKMGTKVINAAVSPSPSDVLTEPVEMTFEKNIVGKTFAEECSFWIENDSLSGEHGRWSTRQCSRTFENQSHIKCACYHFTNFAVLFKIDDQNVSDEDTFRLVIITFIGLSLSILGCLLTFIIYVTLSSIKSDRAIIHTNLVLALGIADVIFLVTVAVKPVGDSCLVLAMLAFFFYLAVFFWMLVEGVYIYLMVIKVFRGNVARRRRMAYLVGWGCPIIIAAITWAALRDDVVSKYHCWLSVESGAIWAFVGPGLAIILINCIILVAVMKTTWATFVDDKEYGGLKSATKTFGAVIPILGITWVFGVMAFNESSIVFQYIFAITNSIQGALIFILYCIVNNEVRNELRRKITIWRTRREMSSSSGGTRRTTYPYVVSSEKNTTFNRTTVSAQATPDLYRYPLGEIKEVPPSGQIEQRYSFEDPNRTPEKESELDGEEKNGGQEAEADRDSGRSSPVEVGKDSGTNEACDDSIGHV